ncbi:cah-2 [Pristionchus pacificus]|uniref:Cah-2 n=1 Tax=Pristionchus pacificus TaxID=54126 RepID=A0A2A6CTI1_PRIPA|nr:cah-2 [Pristionchus pacificus]|eukprot:PDM81534.1 cah-2 [Pristionchus pacificus]
MIAWLMTACMYPCVMGPDFWGLVNKEWRMCKNGQAQSPINIDPNKLLFDPNLSHIKMDDGIVDAVMENIGQMPMITINSTTTHAPINITGGPAMPYKYRLSQIIVHFGAADGGEKGSEHTVDRVRFPAEIQLIAYNSDLYENYTVAESQPRGLLAIAVIVDIGSTTHPELLRMTKASHGVTYKGNTIAMRKLRPAALLPKTNHYVTYDGSLTYPGCHETVTWVIMNNPIYITKQDLAQWNELQQTEKKAAITQPMQPIYRPLRALNGRLLRTNINVQFKSTDAKVTCPAPVYSELGYRANGRHNHNRTHNKHRRAAEETEVDVWSTQHRNEEVEITIDSL